jgi:transketolase
MRNAFSKTIQVVAGTNKNVVLLTGDLGYSVFEPFAARYPSRYFNMGVAEAHMMGTACGMALSGLIPIVYSIATFSSMRGFEQIRTDICIHNANVKIVGTGAGLSYSLLGVTHFALEDIAILRSLPNMTILCPSDPLQAAWATNAMIDHPGPVYLRLGKTGEPALYTSQKGFKIGKGIVLKEGKKIALFATGNIVSHTKKAADILAKKGLDVTVIDMPTIKPIDKKIIKQVITNHQHLFTVEEHTIFGGLGSATAEIIAESNTAVHFERIGFPAELYDTVGTQEYLRQRAGLSPEGIAKTVQKGYQKYA